ncbi:MAG: ImmA/IrrE family metallo-endopeptidase [Flavobacteriaceae bacterium]|nr:ImmA/IrrE family metallo-endopeptidase [Flavobacteriaceae bacterium]
MSSRRVLQSLQPQVLIWARQRAQISPDFLAKKMKIKIERILNWEQTGEISMAQIDKLAQITRTPIGYLFLSHPPKEKIPIQDFRTLTKDIPKYPSPDLTDTIQLMLRRQDWMREELIEAGVEPLTFVGSCQDMTSIEEVVHSMRRAFSLDEEWAFDQKDWESAFQCIRQKAEKVGIFIVINGVVGNNAYRKLNRKEFQGFALVDQFAPFVFINGADFKTAQMFTLAHELAHIFQGSSGLSQLNNTIHNHHTEQICDAIAAEFLIPKKNLISHWDHLMDFGKNIQNLSHRFKVSEFALARQALHSKLIHKDEYHDFYKSHIHVSHRIPKASGGHFWYTQLNRVGRKFGTAIGRAVLSNRMTYLEAYDLTGLYGKTFQKFINHLDFKI